MTLSEALAQVDLEPGQTYHCQVQGLNVELKVRLEVKAPPVSRRRPSAEPVELRDCDLTPDDNWVELPGPKPVARLKPTHKADFSPIVLDLTDDQLKPE